MIGRDVTWLIGTATGSERCRVGVQRARVEDENGRGGDVPRGTERVPLTPGRARRTHQATGRARQTQR